MIAPSGLVAERTGGQRQQADSLLIATYCCTLVTLGCIATDDLFLHWFIIPVLLSGIIIGIDAVDWARGRYDTFDPIALVGVYGVHFFFLAPLLVVAWGYWLPYVERPENYRDWLAWMALLNLLGLAVYRLTRTILLQRHRPWPAPVWRLDRRRFYLISAVALVVTAIAQVMVYASYGGIGGYIAAATDQTAIMLNMRGMGIIYLISESFPILAMMLFAVYARDKPACKTWLMLGLVLLVFFALKLFFGGLRGNRSVTIWGMFWAIGIIHFWLRPVPRKLVLSGLVFLVIFMYLFGFYKNVGLDALQVVQGGDQISELEETTQRNMAGLLLGDLARSDLQAFVLHRLTRPDSDYEYAYGRTYYAAVAVLIPRSLAERPPSKTKEGTEALHGRGEYIPIYREATQLYGLTGEAMLNFGPLIVPFMFIVLAITVAGFRLQLQSFAADDARLLIFPLLLVCCFLLLVADLENIIYLIVKELTVPLAVVLVSRQ